MDEFEEIMNENRHLKEELGKMRLSLGKLNH